MGAFSGTRASNAASSTRIIISTPIPSSIARCSTPWDRNSRAGFAWASPAPFAPRRSRCFGPRWAGLYLERRRRLSAWRSTDTLWGVRLRMNADEVKAARRHAARRLSRISFSSPHPFLSRHAMPSSIKIVLGALLISLLLLPALSAYEPPTAPAPRPFRYDTDTFSFANETVWNYVNGQVQSESSRDRPASATTPGAASW